MSPKDNIEKLLVTHRRRLQILKEQQAMQGISVDPRILIEIEDIEAEIEKLQKELETLEDSSVDEEPQRAEKTQALRQLRTVLASLYDRETDARRIAQDAGLEVTSLRLGDSAVNNWHNILSEAEKRDKIHDLVKMAQEEYPARRELAEAYQAYDQAK